MKKWPMVSEIALGSAGLVNGKPVICGTQICYEITANGWIRLSYLKVLRTYQRSIVINGTYLWVTGILIIGFKFSMILDNLRTSNFSFFRYSKLL